MTEAVTFAERIRERYPEGLTGVFAVGGTRMSYILTRNRQKTDPGQIDEMGNYADYGLSFLRELIAAFLGFGGQNVVVPVLSYQLFTNERGPEYAETTAKLTLELMNDQWIEFYRDQEIDPYFTGIDTLLQLPDQVFTYNLGVKCREFNENWVYKQGRRKLIWEIAPIPLFSFWRAHEVMGDSEQTELAAKIEAAGDLQTVHDLMYKYYSRAVYGTDLPVPHFYLGTNRNGDLKLRALLPIALLCGGPFRLYYTPYPSLFLKRETLQAILEDLAFGKRLRSTKIDY
ncbi:MAG: hypothetical protein ABI835_18165, partial [Chloroflexota bacterium]